MKSDNFPGMLNQAFLKVSKKILLCCVING